MPLVTVLPNLKHESVSLATIKTTASLVIPESGLVQEDITMAPTHVVTKQRARQIMETNTSKSWVIFWFNDENSVRCRSIKQDKQA